MIINSNNYSILEIINMLDRKELVVNRIYQRGAGLWPDGPSSYFIDTILEGYPFPKIYIHDLIDTKTRGLKKEIVDGQQRIRTIQRFFSNDLTLKGDTKFAGMRFEDLDDEAQNRFLTYSVSVDLIRNATHPEILQMFRRMNAYTLPLNEPEKRHSTFQGRFKWFINSLADTQSAFFVEFGVFTSRQILRMADAELITDCILAMEKGVVSTSSSDLRGLYKKYDENFDQADEYKNTIVDTFRFIVEELEPLRSSFMMKPYALHSLVTALIHRRYGIEALKTEWGVPSAGSFADSPEQACNNLLTLAQAHETKDTDGPYATYVWGCLAGTNRAPRRTARVASVLRALGTPVPDTIDADIA